MDRRSSHLERLAWLGGLAITPHCVGEMIFCVHEPKELNDVTELMHSAWQGLVQGLVKGLAKELDIVESFRHC